MFWDVVVVSSFLAYIALAIRGGPVPVVDLPEIDRPPTAAKIPLPRTPLGVRRYVGQGLVELDRFLIKTSGREPLDQDPRPLED